MDVVSEPQMLLQMVFSKKDPWLLVSSTGCWRVALDVLSSRIQRVAKGARCRPRLWILHFLGLSRTCPVLEAYVKRLLVPHPVVFALESIRAERALEASFLHVTLRSIALELVAPLATMFKQAQPHLLRVHRC